MSLLVACESFCSMCLSPTVDSALQATFSDENINRCLKEQPSLNLCYRPECKHELERKFSFEERKFRAQTKSEYRSKNNERSKTNLQLETSLLPHIPSISILPPIREIVVNECWACYSKPDKDSIQNNVTCYLCQRKYFDCLQHKDKYFSTFQYICKTCIITTNHH